MAEIGLIRVDSRLIHGQVITKWLTYAKANRIIVVDDQLASDSFMSKIYANSAPKDIQVQILNLSDFNQIWQNQQLGQGVVLILFKDIATLYQVFKQGFPLKIVQLGGLPGGFGKEKIYKAISLTPTEKQQLIEIANAGNKIEMQVIPEDSKADFMKIIERR